MQLSSPISRYLSRRELLRRALKKTKAICPANFPYQLHRDHPIIIFNSGLHCGSALESQSHYARIQCSNYGIMKSNDFKRFTLLLTYLNRGDALTCHVTSVSANFLLRKFFISLVMRKKILFPFTKFSGAAVCREYYKQV